MERTITAIELMNKIITCNEDTDVIIALIATYADVFNYAYLEAALNNEHSLHGIWDYGTDVSFYIMQNYRLPLNYALRRLAIMILSDDHTVIILRKYMDIYNDVEIFNISHEYTTLLENYTYNNMYKSLKYLLDIGVTHFTANISIYDMNLEQLFADCEAMPEMEPCVALIMRHYNVMAHNA